MKVVGGKANWWLPKWLERILPNLNAGENATAEESAEQGTLDAG